MSDLDFKVTTVTPELAEHWLTKNTHNRNIRLAHVRGLASDMKAGEWAWNGEAIKFASDGTLLDGQHRLAAVVESGTAIKMLVVENVKGAAQHTMDTGSKRTPGDMFRLRGEKNYNLLASGTRGAIVWEAGRRLKDGSAMTVTNTQILRYVEAHPEMRDYVAIARRVTQSVPIPGSVVVLAVKLFYEIDADDAEHFFARLVSDEGHYKGEPVYALRAILLQPKSQSRISYTSDYKLAVIIKAWNKFRAGESVGLLVFRPGGASPEKFPVPM